MHGVVNHRKPHPKKQPPARVGRPISEKRHRNPKGEARAAAIQAQVSDRETAEDRRRKA